MYFKKTKNWLYLIFLVRYFWIIFVKAFLYLLTTKRIMKYIIHSFIEIGIIPTTYIYTYIFYHCIL